MKNLRILIPFLFMALSCSAPSEIELTGGSGWTSRKEYSDFGISGQARTSEGAVAAIRFCLAGDAEGYEVLLHNGPSSSVSRARAANGRRPSRRRHSGYSSTSSPTP